MKYLLILSCLLFIFVGCSKTKTINSDDLEERKGLYYEKSMENPFTGSVTGEKQGKIIRGKREGEWKIYYENSQLNEIGNLPKVCT